MIKGIIKSVKEYRQSSLDSSSSLKDFSLDRRKYFKKYIQNEKIEEEDQSKASIIGQCVETLLFEKDQFDNRFCLSCLQKPVTGLMEAFVEALYKHTKEAKNEEGEITRSFEDISKDAYRDSGFKIKYETVIEKFVGKDPEIYFKELLDIRERGLVVVTIQDVENSEKIVQELKTNEITAPILNLVDSNRYKALIQYQIEGYEIDGLPLKSMIDFLIIDHKEKTLQVYDLKVTFSVEGFFNEYYLYRRAYIQAFLYKEACKELRIRQGLEYYNVLDPKFIVADSINYMQPLIYTLDSDDVQDAYLGFEYNGRKYPGVKEIIESLKWAKEHNIWTISMKNYLNNGITNIKG